MSGYKYIRFYVTQEHDLPDDNWVNGQWFTTLTEARKYARKSKYIHTVWKVYFDHDDLDYDGIETPSTYEWIQTYDTKGMKY